MNRVVAVALVPAALLLSLASACGGSHPAPPVLPTIPLPAGAQLSPYDAAKPGEAHPSGIVALNGKVYVTLGNSSAGTFAVAGPGFVAAVVPSTGVTTLVNLGGTDGKACQNPGAIRVFNNLIYVACTGPFGGTAGRAIVEIDPAHDAVSRIAALDSSPTSLALGSGKIWYGSEFGDKLSSLDLASFTKATASATLGCPMGTTMNSYNYVPDVASLDGALYALCASDTNDLLYRVDPATGNVVAQVAVGALATSVAPTGDGRLAVVSSGANSLSFVAPSGSGLTATAGVQFATATSTLQDVRSLGQFLYTTASGSNTVQKIDLKAAGGPKVVAEANTGAGSNPYSIAPLDDTQAVVTDLVTNNLVGVIWQTH